MPASSPLSPSGVYRSAAVLGSKNAKHNNYQDFQAFLDAGGDCFTRAIGTAILAAESVQTPAGRWRSYREAFPSALRT